MGAKSTAAAHNRGNSQTSERDNDCLSVQGTPFSDKYPKLLCWVETRPDFIRASRAVLPRSGTWSR